MTSALPLPSFRNPPVVEVALSVQFDSIPELQTPHLGLLWSRFREDFPRTEEHPPLTPVIEKFGPSGLRPQRIALQLTTRPPSPRLWFLNERGTQLIQIQQDRFVHNWKKTGDDEVYPRYETVRTAFLKGLTELRQFLASNDMHPLVPRQCEVTYVNHILAPAPANKHVPLHVIIPSWHPKYGDTFLSEPEEASLSMRFLIPGPEGEPVGRLHVSLEATYRAKDLAPVWLMTLTSRGEPIGSGEDSVERFLDLGREWVVRGFTSLTSPEMHRIWGREDVG